MNDETRAALCGYEYQNTDVPADRNFLADLHGPDGMVSYADVLRLLAERETTVPDAERVERAAEAIYDYLANSNDLDEMIGEVELLIATRESAKVALAAAGPETEWLDAALNGDIRFVNGRKHMDGIWRVKLGVSLGPGQRIHPKGEGTSLPAAIKDAIATALAAKQEGAGK